MGQDYIDEPVEEAETVQVSPEEFMQFVTDGKNLAGELTDAQLTEIAQDVISGYEIDKASMSDWLDKMRDAIDLAKLVKEDKTYPFDKAANIKYPLITSAALQFNARAYPAIIPATDVVKAKVWGPDPEGKKAARGLRCSTFMSHQLLVVMEEWEVDMDKLLVQLPIVGDLFKKVWHDGQRERSKIIEPGAYIVNNKAQTIGMAPRGTEELCYYPYEIKERIASGWFVDFEYDVTGEDDEAAVEFLEQSCRIDLDEDGYPEPYVVTVCRESDTIVRIVADFDMRDVEFKREMQQVETVVEEQRVMPDGTPFIAAVPVVQEVEAVTGVISIKRNSYVVHYQFMPGMDGGLFGIGLGILLGDISKAINTSFNMLIDAGHYASLGGGFIGQEFRLKGGAQRMRPGEWRTAQTTGDNVRNSIVPMTYPGPDQTLFAMLGMLIDAGKEVSSTKDIMTGDAGGKTQTATTTLALIEQGMKVFTACYKRIFRSLQKEFRLIAELNAKYLSPERYSQFLDQQADPQADFSATDMDVQPVADPEAVTKMQEMARAQILMEMAQNGLVNPAAAAARILEAASIDDIEELLPPPPDPMQQEMQMRAAQMAEQAAQLDMNIKQADLSLKMAEIEKKMAEVEKLRADAYSTVAGVQNDARAQRFDEVITILEEQRNAAAESLAGIRAGLAGAPGNGGAQGGIRRLAGIPAQGPGGGFSLGPAGPGIGQGGGPDGIRVA